jgi:xanthine dehydrogenase accessory factor
LQEAGIGADEVNRLHGPAGLNIGALTPAEIAVSILAEMIAAERMPGEMSG